MRASFVLAAALELAACGTLGHRAPPLPEVRIPIVQTCITDKVPRPPKSYADDGLAKVADPAERMRRVAAANFERKGRLEILEPVVRACR
jgi:hypothetical protein